MEYEKALFFVLFLVLFVDNYDNFINKKLKFTADRLTAVNFSGSTILKTTRGAASIMSN